MRASLLASAIAQHVVMQPLFGSLNPGFEPVGGPPGWLDPDQHDPMPPARRGRAGIDCHARISCRGSYDRRCRFVLAPVQAMQRNHAPWQSIASSDRRNYGARCEVRACRRGGEDARQLCPQEWCPCRTPSKAPPHFGPEEGATTKYRPSIETKIDWVTSKMT